MAKEKPERAAVVAAIAQRHYPPALKYPERQKDSLLSTWFAYPTLTWAPECLTPTRKPKCIVQECPCEPKVKEYMQRTVEDVEHKTRGSGDTSRSGGRVCTTSSTNRRADMDKNACMDSETLRDIWLTQTNIYITLCEAQMADTVWNCAIKLDHLQKFCSKLKVHGADDSKIQPGTSSK
ncbi:hypothetical protein F444_17754 [Phytophthora nicotianae P1976]|uniref:Uncharacterized protein n=1 Tax=Phytophthora nicotianae P1976 TaxID=1317066 RepID=A0A080ZDX3_PHYNI|nr:hypothetical protein F444_17754 [Phytophthora nicotianae P1976]